MHSRSASTSTDRPNGGIRLPLFPPQGVVARKKYPGWNETFGQVWDVIIEHPSGTA